MSASKAARAFILLGECVPCVKQNASRFQIKRLELDPHLLMVTQIFIQLTQL